MKRMDVCGVRLELPLNAPLLLLHEADGTRYLPIWIGAAEATAIANVLEGEVPPRPFTHDLVVDLLREVSQPITEVRITDVSETQFFAVIVIGGREISARPSDAVALALRSGAPVMCADVVLDLVGVELDGDDHEVEVQRFRDFLDSVTAEQFST